MGGTGLYIDSLIKGYTLVESNTRNRDALDKLSVEQLQGLISKETLGLLNNSDRNNPRRLIRVIEKSEHIGSNNEDFELENLILYPLYHWEELKLKIDKRVERMFADGLVEETKGLLLKGLTDDSESLKIMGYKQVVEYLKNKIDLNTCIERVKIAHKQYAKRQKTWFEGSGRGYKLNKYSNIEEALKLSDKFIKNEI